MRAALLALLLSACATTSEPEIQICGIQPIGTSQGVMVVRMRCEAEQ